MPKKKTHQEFVGEVFGLVGNSYEVIGDYINNRTHISMKHNECGHKFEMKPTNFLRGQRCPSCFGNMKKTTEQFKSEIKKLVGNSYEVLGDYINSRTHITMKHNDCGHKFEMKPKDFLRGNRCPKCAGNAKKTTEQFKDEVKSLVENSYEVLGEYENALTIIKMKHNECEHEWGITPNAFLRGRRCPKCSKKYASDKLRKSTEQFKKEVFEAVGNSYEVLDKYENNYTKTSMKHNECGHEWEITPANFLNGTRCPKCNESKGEKEISNILDKLSIIYQPQYRFDDCRNILPLPFDFAVFDNNYNLKALIEYQGRQHYEHVEVFGGEEGYIKTINNDLIKKRYCKRNSIKLIVIPYWEFDNIENILKDELINSSNKTNNSYHLIDKHKK